MKYTVQRQWALHLPKFLVANADLIGNFTCQQFFVPTFSGLFYFVTRWMVEIQNLQVQKNLDSQINL